MSRLRLTMRRAGAMLAVAVLCAGVVGAASPASAEPTPVGSSSARAAGPYHLYNPLTQKCLGISGSSTANGAAAIQWTCAWQTYSDQNWYLDDLGGGYWQLRNQVSNKCLGISGAGTANGVPAIQWTCAYNQNSDQAWYEYYLGNGYYQFVNRISGKCFGISGASTANGAQAIQWTCAYNQNSDQAWQYWIP